MADVKWPVHTGRLLLRPATAADREQVWKLWRHRDDVAQWMTNPSPDLETRLSRLATPERLATILAVEYEGRIVMEMHLRVQDSFAQTDVADQARGTLANLGWSMDPVVHWRGLATEALRAARATT